MTDRENRVPAQCDDCHRPYRVASTERTYECRECGGTVRALVHDLEELERAAEERREVARSLKDAHRWIDAVAWIYRLGAFAYAGATLAAILALKSREVPVQAGILVVGLTTTLCVLMLMGALHILFRPFVWTVVIASLATGVSAVHWFGPNPFGVAFAASAALAVVAWAAIYPTLRFQRLVADHKDLYILHHSSARTRRSLRGRTPEQRHERLLRAMRRASRRAWKLSTVGAVVAVLVSTGGTWGVLNTLRPQELSAGIERFESAWGNSDLLGVYELFDDGVRDQRSTWLRGALSGRGFGRELPPLVQESTTQTEYQARVDYSAGAFPLTAVWSRSGRSWILEDVELPRPEIEPHVERFLSAWRMSDVESIVAGFSEEKRNVIREAFERRGWKPLPKIDEVEIGERDERQTLVTLHIEEGDVTTHWHIEPDASWSMHGVHFSAP